MKNYSSMIDEVFSYFLYLKNFGNFFEAYNLNKRNQQGYR